MPCSRATSSAAAWRADGHEGPVRLQAGLALHVRRGAGAQDLVIDAYCVFAERVERAGAILDREDQQPVMGFRGVCDNYLFGPTSQPVRHERQQRRLVRGQRRGGGRRPRPVRRGHGRRRLDPYPGRLVRRLRLQALVRPRAAVIARTPSGARPRSSTRGRSRGRSRTRRSCWARSPATTRAIPYSLDEHFDFMPATRRGDPRHAHRLQPRPGCLPRRPAHREGRARSGRRLRGGRRARRGGQPASSTISASWRTSGAV